MMEGLDKEWVKARNREIEIEVSELRGHLITLNNEFILSGERIEKLLKERDDITYKFRLAGIPMSVIAEEPELTGDSRFRFITEEMATLYSKKNADYGDAFTESLDEDGLLVSKIRIKDKLKRFSQLIDNDALVNDESMRDTLIDLANYSVMTLMWLDENE